MSAGRRLARSLEASAKAAGCTVRVSDVEERAWASATFFGARHTMLVEGGPAAAMAEWLAALPEAVPSVPGHLMADVAVERVSGAARVAVLLLEG